MQQLFFRDRYEATNLEVGTPKFLKLAQVYGIKGMKLTQRQELKDAIAEMIAHEGSVILEAYVTKNEDGFPMIAPGHSNNDMMGLHHNSHFNSATNTRLCSSCGTANPTTHKCCCECGAKL